ncbi:uncharacterized protein LOC114307978 isoform X2 [Camellia sinensis]|uniref:uncharacterized protein LOC114307978 isoform X2 n=1 Tax=Camellia sinensis TaxID=4442 RepID=UPI001036A589|nr:uncharacterized protein LOC114307978 isoform X2 [Camellia sinensis]
MFIIKQHFEPSKVGILARCLCIPLVSIRVGKINKQGTLMCPTDLNKIIDVSNRKRTTEMLLKECVLLGAIPFFADVERLKDLGVVNLACFVI